ncbi:uncharacterized protein [Narcine bancroftii]|uniref:uncharacterized protein isoform X2 n=1 Tax=Narcine bancroftii TaxID=1343680 RepID=UPI003831BE7C
MHTRRKCPARRPLQVSERAVSPHAAALTLGRKMGRPPTAALLLLSLISVLKPSNSEVFHGVVGFNLSIPFTIPLNTVEIICTVKGIKVFEWENDTETNYFGAFSERTKLTESRILIQKLQLNDSGVYFLTFISAEGKLEKKSFNLVVHEPLAKPKIYCIRNDSIIHLNCYFEGNDNSSVIIEWKHQDNIVQQDEVIDFSLERTRLTILNPEKSSAYTCHVEQAGHQVKSDPINIQDCSKEGNARVHVILVLILILLIIGIFIVGAYYLRQKYGKVKNKYEGPCKKNPNVGSSQEVKEETKLQQLDEEANPQVPDGEEAKSELLGDEEIKPQPSGLGN